MSTDISQMESSTFTNAPYCDGRTVRPLADAVNCHKAHSMKKVLMLENTRTSIYLETLACAIYPFIEARIRSLSPLNKHRDDDMDVDYQNVQVISL